VLASSPVLSAYWPLLEQAAGVPRCTYEHVSIRRGAVCECRPNPPYRAKADPGLPPTRLRTALASCLLQAHQPIATAHLGTGPRLVLMMATHPSRHVARGHGTARSGLRWTSHSEARSKTGGVTIFMLPPVPGLALLLFYANPESRMTDRAIDDPPPNSPAVDHFSTNGKSDVAEKQPAMLQGLGGRRTRGIVTDSG